MVVSPLKRQEVLNRHTKPSRAARRSAGMKDERLGLHAITTGASDKHSKAIVCEQQWTKSEDGEIAGT